VVVTGAGILSALGLDRGAFWRALSAGECGIAPITGVPRERLIATQGAEVKGFDPQQVFTDRGDLGLDRFAQFALLAAKEALADSGLQLTEALCQRGAVVTGSCVGGVGAQESEYKKFYGEGKDRLHPATVPRTMANAGASRVSMQFNLRGPVFNLSTACSSSNHALGMAYWLVRDGITDVALAGGSEAPFTLGNLKAWDAIRVVAPDVCRPFSKGRKGMILGEGGAFLVLEPRDAALARGARIYAEIAGFGMTADAGHLTTPTVEGPSSAMRMALADGGIDPETVGYINAHGTGTEANDANEAQAIRTVFGPHAKSVAVSSTKSMHGHALGAAGAIEAVATVLTLHHGLLPPTANWQERDPDCDLDLVLGAARPARVEVALSNSFAFGGLNAVVAFRRHVP
jgi:nodulation protein E